jgi:hypothetical protein
MSLDLSNAAIHNSLADFIGCTGAKAILVATFHTFHVLAHNFSIAGIILFVHNILASHATLPISHALVHTLAAFVATSVAHNFVAAFHTHTAHTLVNHAHHSTNAKTSLANHTGSCSNVCTKLLPYLSPMSFLHSGVNNIFFNHVNVSNGFVTALAIAVTVFTVLAGTFAIIFATFGHLSHVHIN